MKRRIITLLVGLCLLLCLLPTAAFAEATKTDSNREETGSTTEETGGRIDESRSYNFDLSVGGGDEVRASVGETITVTLTLKRTDSSESARMYGMQTEINYDDGFLQLVEGSVMTASGVRWVDLGRRTGGRAFYLNFVSFRQGGESWEPEVVVGSFQMKVIGTKGVAQLVPENSMVSTQDGMAGYLVEDNPVSVIVTTDCTVTFESNGGTEVSTQTVPYGEKVKEPEEPTREGYHLEGWYRNLDRTLQWDFDKDTVKSNMTLYANWAEGLDQESSSWWMITGGILLALLLVLLLFLGLRGKKKVCFETNGGTEVEAISVKRGSVIGETAIPTKSGAVFDGWFADQDFTQSWDTRKDPVCSSMTLYAHWDTGAMPIETR